jgi:hypothetical protein
MRPLKNLNEPDTGSDATAGGPWNDGFQQDIFNGSPIPGLNGQTPPGISNHTNPADSHTMPNEHALSAPPFRDPPSTGFALDNSLRVLSEEGDGKPSPVTITSTTSTSSTTMSSGGASTTSPFVINIAWDSSVASAPAGFKPGVIAAVQYLESQFVDAVTVNIDVGYGEVNGYSVGGLGASSYYLSSVGYSSLLSALKGDAKDATDASGVASLPTTSPTNGTFWTTSAQAKALGLASPNGTSVDGYVGFSSNYQFDYDNSDGVTGGMYDFNGTVLHEITEVLGRALLTGGTIGSTPNSYYAYDLLHYSAPGVRDFSASTPGYFSVDGGATNLGGFNTVSGGDAGDWGSSMGYDSANAYANSGVTNAFSTADLTAMDAIGWDAVGSTTVAPPPALPPIVPSSTPTGVSIAALATSLSNALSTSSPIATVTQVGGATADTYSYQLGGAGAGAFALSTSGNVGTLKSAAALAGSLTGTAYALTVTATDVTSGNSSAAAPLNVVVGSGDNDTISAVTLSGNLALAAPAFVLGGAGNDTISATGMTGNVWLSGGAGADKMTGGSGVNTYMYSATSDSTSSVMDIITNFNASVDRVDLTGLGTALQYAGSIQSNGKGLKANVIAAHSVGWQTSGGNTFVYVNTSGAQEGIGASNMEIELVGSLSLGSGNFVHA